MDLIKEGQKLTLFFQKNENMVEMTCEIEEVYSDRINLILPKFFMRYIEFLQPSCKLTAKVFTKFGTIDFNTVVITSPLEDNFSIELDYNAVKLASNGELAAIDATEDLDLKINGTLYNTRTFEISTEYIKFYSDIPLEVGAMIDCSLNLSKHYGIINFRARVSEVDAIYSNEYTAVFSKITETARQDLLYYMYIYTTN